MHRYYKCTRCGVTTRIIALIDDAGVIERILKPLHAGKSKIRPDDVRGGFNA